MAAIAANCSWGLSHSRSAECRNWLYLSTRGVAKVPLAATPRTDLAIGVAMLATLNEMTSGTRHKVES